MPRVVLPPKYVQETRTDPVDFGPYVPTGVGIVDAQAIVGVYSGVDAGISLVATCAAPTPGSSLVKVTLQNGLLGVIYFVTVRATFTNGDIIPISYFIAVVPDVT